MTGTQTETDNFWPGHVNKLLTDAASSDLVFQNVGNKIVNHPCETSNLLQK
jgi:hypothetical protein